MAVASGEESAHDLTPLVGHEAKEQWPVAREQWPLVSESARWELAVREKRQNEANLPVVLIVGIL